MGFIEQGKAASLNQAGMRLEVPVKDFGELTRSINELQEVINRYDSLVSRLSIKLIPILLQPRPECVGPSGGADRVYDTDMANRVNSIRNIAMELNNNLESIIERVEL